MKTLEIINNLVFFHTGVFLTELEKEIVLRSMFGKQKYRDIANELGFTEGYIKDVGYELWQKLSITFQTTIHKTNARKVLEDFFNPDSLSLNPSTHSSNFSRKKHPKDNNEILEKLTLIDRLLYLLHNNKEFVLKLQQQGLTKEQILELFGYSP